MTFTIPEFWLGVLATMLAELITLIVAAIVQKTKNKKEK